MYVSSYPEARAWREAKISIPVDNNYEGMASTKKNDRISSPAISPCYGQCCKEENSIYPLYDRNFNFTAKINGEGTSEDDDYHHSSLKRKITVTRDPMSHRIIEKRRRDRMNNCLADLSRLIPQEYLKKGRGRIEKTEIIEMAIKHMKNLQAMTNNASVDTFSIKGKTNSNNDNSGNSHHTTRATMGSNKSTDRYKLGYQECLSEMMRFLVEFQGLFASDTLCLKLMNHLQKYYEKLTEDETQLPIISESIVTSNNLKIKTREHRTKTREIDRNITTSVVSAIHSDDSCQDGNYFNVNYYRNGVVNDSRSNLFCDASSIKRDVISDIPSSPEPSYHYTDCLNDIPSPNGALYKFKKYICERFEHSKTDHSSVTSTVVNCQKKKIDLINSIHSTSTVEHDDKNDTRLVPIFALHSQGSFYVPLTVDSRLLTPFLKELNNNDEVQDLSSLLLHPVTISVKFNRHAVSATSTSPFLLSSNLDGSTQNTRTGLLFVP